MALLFRAMTDLWPYESALADEGFDYHTIGGSAFYAQQEVHDVINLLSVVEDPFDEIALAGALRSPFFGVSDEGLFWLATTFEDGGLTAGLYRLDEIARALRPRPPPRGAGASSCSRDGGRTRIACRWRGWWPGSSTSRASRRRVVCEFLGDRKLANTRKIVRLARDFDRQGGFTLAEFVARLRADLENEPREEQAATTDEAGASIRLMSIHQAKGLEFPIVVLPDLARTSRSRRARWSPAVRTSAWSSARRRRRPARCNRTRPMTSSDPAVGSLAWQAYLTLERSDDEQESLRLFYVAATRARDALILSAGLGPDEPVKSTSVAMRLLDERFDRRTGLCRVASEDLVATPAVQVTPDESPRTPRRPRIDVEPRSSITAIEEAITRATPSDLKTRPGPPRPRDTWTSTPPRACRPAPPGSTA